MSNNKTIILNRPTLTMYIDNNTLEVDLIDTKYDEEGFKEFLNYFKNTWIMFNKNKEIYKMFINLGDAVDSELPLFAYMSLLKTILDINDILKTNCHCICILTKGHKKWRDMYNLLTKLWSTKDQRPILFTNDIEEKNKFINSNELITEKYPN
tara:strand:+ start:480 stop:938 length:459 start_codon:yes stop_codon:yes gene_type:complete